MKKRMKSVAAMLVEKPASFGRPISKRTEWEALARKKSYQNVIRQAVKLLDQPIPDLPDDLYPAFADCAVNAQPSSQIMSFVSRRYGLGLRQYEHKDTALITLGQWKKLGAGSLQISRNKEAIRVDISASGSDFEIQAKKILEDVETLPTRLGISMKQPVKNTVINLQITPIAGR